MPAGCLLLDTPPTDGDPSHSPDGNLADFIMLLASPAPQKLEEGGFFFFSFLKFQNDSPSKFFQPTFQPNL